MRVFFATLLLTGIGLAQNLTDRAAIEAVIHSLRTAEPVAALFTADAQSDLDRLREIEQRMNNAAHEPWSELAPPVLTIASVRFVSSDVAIVDATESQIGLAMNRIPVLFALRRQNNQWKIAYLRVLSGNPVMIGQAPQ